MGYNHRYHLRCVYREPQFPFISLLSLSLTYVGNILVRRYRPLTDICALIFYALTLLCPYFSAHLPCRALIFFYALTYPLILNKLAPDTASVSRRWWRL